MTAAAVHMKSKEKKNNPQIKKYGNIISANGADVSKNNFQIHNDFQTFRNQPNNNEDINFLGSSHPANTFLNGLPKR
jgi:hypothetical protein